MVHFLGWKSFKVSLVSTCPGGGVSSFGLLSHSHSPHTLQHPDSLSGAVLVWALKAKREKVMRLEVSELVLASSTVTPTQEAPVPWGSGRCPEHNGAGGSAAALWTLITTATWKETLVSTCLLPWWLRHLNPPEMQETRVRSLGWEDPLEKGMAIHSSILVWGIPKRVAWRTTVHGSCKKSDTTEWLTLWIRGAETIPAQEKSRARHFKEISKPGPLSNRHFN